MIWLYNILISLTAPIWAPMVWWRARRRRETPNWKERYGEYKLELDRSRPVLWLHAVSVGEVVASLPVLAEIRRQRPEAQIVLSVTTSTGHQTARDRAVASGLIDHLVYFPIDVARFMWTATWRVKPHAVAIFETELWLNFLQFSKEVGANTLLVNGRISDRSFRRSKSLKFFYRPLLAKLDQALMQTEGDAVRIRDLGTANVEVLGNTKFDEISTSGDSTREKWREKLGIKPEEILIVVGSTRGQAEEAFVFSALGVALSLGAKVVHAPRHIEEAEALHQMVKTASIPSARRSQAETAQYLILDTYGELSHVYAAADIAIIGGGFEPLGGQNLIQPLACGVPVIHGPHMHNFRDVAAAAQAAGASLIATTPEELGIWIDILMKSPEKRAEMGAAGLALVKSNQGASAAYASRIIAAAEEPFEREQALIQRRSSSTAPR